MKRMMKDVSAVATSRPFLSLLLTAIILLALIFSGGPALAVTVSVTPSPSAVTQPNVLNLNIDVTLTSSERLPIQNTLVEIRSAGVVLATATLSPAGALVSSSPPGIFVGSSLVSPPSLGPFYGYGYLYGYQAFTGYGYSGYGYGYGYGAGLTLSYVVQVSSSGLAPGSYEARVQVNVNGTTFPSTWAPFTVSAAPPPFFGGGGGGGGAAPAPVAPVPPPPPPPPPAPAPVSTEVRTDPAGIVTQTVSLTSADGLVSVAIPAGTRALTSDGRPLSSVSSGPLTEVPPAPAEQRVIGLPYDLKPDGASFVPPITVTFRYDPAQIPPGVREQDLVIAFYERTLGQWVQLSNIVVDPATDTITGQTGHLTPFAVLTRALPAPVPIPTPTPTPTPPPPVVTPTPTPTPPPPVVTPTPTPTPPPPVVTPTPTPTPVVTPTPTPPPPVPTPTPTPAPPAVPKPFPWGLVIGIVLAVIVATGLVYWFWWRRREKKEKK